MTPKRGEVWWYEAPERKGRPHLVLTRTEAIPHLYRILAVPASRTVRDIPTEVYLDESDGMPQPCVLCLDNTELLRTPYFSRKITTLGPARMSDVCAALALAVACWA